LNEFDFRNYSLETCFLKHVISHHLRGFKSS